MPTEANNEQKRPGMFEGKKGLVIGVANERSIAWAIAKTIMDEGGECAFTFLPDHPYDERRRGRRRVGQCMAGYEDKSKLMLPLDVQDDRQISHVMKSIGETFGKIDFLLHSVAFALRDDLMRDTVETSRRGFQLAMDISAFSLIAVVNEARPILSDRASVLAMSYFGGEKCIPGYNVMGICKAALEASVRYLAHDLGPSGVRVNALSAGPLKTLAGSAVGVDRMQSFFEAVAPLGRNVTHEEVGRTGAFLLSDMSDGMTGEIMHVDSGYNIMGSPGRLLDQLKSSDADADGGA